MSKERIDEMKKFIQLSEELEEYDEDDDLEEGIGNKVAGWFFKKGSETLIKAIDKYGNMGPMIVASQVMQKPKKTQQNMVQGAKHYLENVNDHPGLRKFVEIMSQEADEDLSGNIREEYDEDDDLSEDFRGTTINPKRMAAQNKATKQRDRDTMQTMKTVAARPPRETGPSDGVIGRMMMDAIGGTVPDGDPFDVLLPTLSKLGIREHEAMFRLNRAARTMGYADYHDALDSVMDMYNQQDTMAVEGFEKGGLRKKMNRYGWFFQGVNPKELIDHVRSASDKDLVQLSKAANEYADESSPRDLQMRLINQELKRRHGLTPKGNLREAIDAESELFYAIIGNNVQNLAVVMLEKEGGYWYESTVSGDSPDSFGGKRYMSYLSPDDIMSWLNRDYNVVIGPFDDEYDPQLEIERMQESEDEGGDTVWENINLTKIAGAVLREAGDIDFDFDDWEPSDDPDTNICTSCLGDGCEECEKEGSVFETHASADGLSDVMRRLRNSAGGANDISDQDWKSIEDDAARRLEKGWSNADIVAFLRNTEELNPDLDEETALRRMKTISDRYIKESKSKKNDERFTRLTRHESEEIEEEDISRIIDVGDAEDYEFNDEEVDPEHLGINVDLDDY